MQKQLNWQLAVKKIKVLQNKLDTQFKLKKHLLPTNIKKTKELFHIQLSFAIICLISKNLDQYEEHTN
jgi:hypothetical protein